MFRTNRMLAPMLLLSACSGGGGGGVVSPAPTPTPTASTSPSPSPTPSPTSALSVRVAPSSFSLPTDATRHYGCQVTGSSDQNCTWTVQEANGGTVSAAGIYAAPAVPGVYHLVARSAADPNATATATITVTTPVNDRPWVTGYYLGYYWDWSYPPDKVDVTALTHLMFARVAPGSGTLGGQAGQVVKGAGTAHDAGLSPDGVRSVEDYLVKRAHDAGKKALLMLGGEGDGDGFLRSSTDAVRGTFVRNLVDYLVAHDYDGIDVDWEDRLEGSAALKVTGEEARRRAIALITDLRAEANARPRYQNGRRFLITFPGYLVSINDLPRDGPREGMVEQWQADIANLVDQYNVMSYGVGSAWNQAGWFSWFSSPIYGATGTTPRDLETSVRAYVKTGVPRSKIGIGIGFYGIYYGPTITGPRQDTEHNNILEIQDTPLRYSELVRWGYLNRGTYSWDETSQVGYRSYPGGFSPAGSGLSQAGFLSYEDELSIAAKGLYVRQTGLGGAIIWAINYDHMPDGTNPLLSAVKRNFRTNAP
ncbi:glycoside hydrolase family 18 protein [Sphingomonas sp. OTU376]|uniref:glycoside hydrolase family 18 protein n=1 Tax=Sphingomonas sp. OTU376 TaxID=3043863 RepID=UPI00313CDDB8